MSTHQGKHQKSLSLLADKSNASLADSTKNLRYACLYNGNKRVGRGAPLNQPNYIWKAYMFLTLRFTRLTALLSLILLAVNPVMAADEVVVENGKQVSFFYKLTVDSEVIDDNEGREPMVYIQGAGQILPALEKELQGMQVKDKKTINLDAANAYGPVDPAAIQEVPTEQIPEDARQVGAVLQAEGYPGPIRVVAVKDDVTTVDFNHPLAGKALTFDVTIAGIETPAAPVSTGATPRDAAEPSSSDGVTPPTTD